jgi:hypothetical protein
LIKQKKYTALGFVLIFIVSFSSTTVKTKSQDVEVKYFSEGLLGQVIVADVLKQNNGRLNGRILFVNRIAQAFIDRNSGASKWSYINLSTAIGSRLLENSKALVLGLGGGTLVNAFQNRLGFNVDAVELDQRIADVAKEYFSLNNQAKIIIDDARHYIETTDKKYDLIFFDLYKGEDPPSHVLSTECFAKSMTLLNGGGFIIINFSGFLNGEAGMPGRSLYKTLNEMGLTVKLLPTTSGTESDRNLLFIVSSVEIDFNEARYLFTRGDIPVAIDSLFLDITQFNTGNEVTLTDDKPQLDHLNMEASGIWRKLYTEAYTKMFKENGVPLFN